MKRQDTTRPCEYCGKPVTKSATQQSQRKYWTCDASCANKLRIKLGNTPGWKPNPLRGAKETRPCVWCGSPVTRYLSNTTTAQVWSCSKACKASYLTKQQMDAGVWRRPLNPRRGDEIACSVCGRMFYRTPAEAKRDRPFCSKACADIAHTKTPVVKNCLTCGKVLKLKPSQAGIQYCSRACMGAGLTKRPLDRMHNGKPARKDQKGYVMVYEPGHPNKAFHGWQYEHRLVAEQAIGRYLRSDEAVHHKNGQKDDNRPENLEVMDLNEHATMSVQDYRDDLNRKLARLAAYERRYGPLKE